MEPTYFASPAEWRAWLEANHETETEVLVGFFKKGTGRAGLTWPQAVDEALCFGWIDAVRRRVDDERYSIRFTRRKPRSTWSAANVARVAELREQGLMREAGERAFARRSAERTAIYSYEQEADATLGDAYEARLRANAAAAAYFDGQPPWYRRTATHWVVRAKREDTRERRLEQLIACSAEGRRVPPLAR